MKTLQRFLTGIGTVLLLAVSLQIFAPKAVHAVVSTLVTVANTTANPIPTVAADNPAKRPFFASATCTNRAGDDQCVAGNFLAVPPGLTAVVQDVSGYCRVEPGHDALGVPIYTFVTSSNGGGVEMSMGPQVADGGSLLVYHFGRTVNFYVPSTAAAPDGLNFSAVTLFGLDCNVLVNGYYVANGQ